jgi:hypothetical protein
MNNNVKQKKCGKCGKTKPEFCFNANVSKKDGLSYHCKDCHTVYMREYNRKRRNVSQSIQINKPTILRKTCNECGYSMPVSEFPLNSNQAYGYDNTCKECIAKSMPVNTQKKTITERFTKVVENSLPKTKTCVRCHVTKNNSEFYNHKHTLDGLQTWCKQCQIDYARDKRNPKVNLESKLSKLSIPPNFEQQAIRFVASCLRSVCKNDKINTYLDKIIKEV